MSQYEEDREFEAGAEDQELRAMRDEAERMARREYEMEREIDQRAFEAACEGSRAAFDALPADDQAAAVEAAEAAEFERAIAEGAEFERAIANDLIESEIPF